MTWNYRIVKEKGCYSIRDVYYGDKDKVEAWASEPQWPQGDSILDLKLDWEMMGQAFERPVLKLDKKGKKK